MASLLEGVLKAKIAKGFQGKLLRGTIRSISSTALNSFGDPVPATTTDYTFEGIRDYFSALYAAQSGIPDTDVRILILLGSVQPVYIPKQENLVHINLAWHKIRRILSIDPAGASMSVQAYEVDEP